MGTRRHVMGPSPGPGGDAGCSSPSHCSKSHPVKNLLRMGCFQALHILISRARAERVRCIPMAWGAQPRCPAGGDALTLSCHPSLCSQQVNGWCWWS